MISRRWSRSFPQEWRRPSNTDLESYPTTCKPSSYESPEYDLDQLPTAWVGSYGFYRDRFRVRKRKYRQLGNENSTSLCSVNSGHHIQTDLFFA